jgi:hypothetical protein
MHKMRLEVYHTGRPPFRLPTGRKVLFEEILAKMQGTGESGYPAVLL